MAKKKKDSINDGEEVKENSILTTLIVFFIILIWLVIFIIFVKLDIGSFGSSVLAPIIRDVPVINLILPEEIDIIDQNESKDDYSFKTIAEAIQKIKDLEKEIDILTKNDDIVTDDELQKEINRLKVFEENQTRFEEIKQKFDKSVVFTDNAPNIEEYKDYYELINPENAEIIYRQVIEQLQHSQAIKEKADIYRKMEPKAAAKILETMTADTEAVAKILLNMRPKESAAILAQMDHVFASKITKKMLDLDEEMIS
ncbi:MAG TPA: hypothetical protein GXZ90_09445 [Clostridiales bacterium]|nr:hypothetical protein [Clostridiales bacterium]